MHIIIDYEFNWMSRSISCIVLLVNTVSFKQQWTHIHTGTEHYQIYIEEGVGSTLVSYELCMTFLFARHDNFNTHRATLFTAKEYIYYSVTCS